MRRAAGQDEDSRESGTQRSSASYSRLCVSSPVMAQELRPVTYARLLADQVHWAFPWLPSALPCMTAAPLELSLRLLLLRVHAQGEQWPAQGRTSAHGRTPCHVLFHGLQATGFARSKQGRLG